MGFLDKFFRKQKERKLEKQAKKQQEAVKDLKLKKDVKKPEKIKKAPIKKEDKKEIVKINTKGTKPKFKVNTSKILVKPLITEKVSDMAVLRKYAFEVTDNANKLMIKKAVSALYGVRVRDVRIVNVRGKKVRHARQWGKRKNWKKAIVTLVAGEKIEIYEGV